VPLFAVATFLNAALLFAVEPLFTKMVLPLLGGTPSVWNTCLLFFQAALLAGYLYAHLSSRWLSAGRQAALHLALLLVALLTLPIALAPNLAVPTTGTGAAIAWLLALLATTLGAPFVLLAAGTPMLQRWFAATRHPLAGNPYFLYVASNLGSFAALVAYPTVIEPRWRLGEQSTAWTVGFVALLLLVALAAWLAQGWRTGASDSPPVATATRSDAAREEDGDGEGDPTLVPTDAWRLRWILLSFAPSSLLLGVTTYLSTDIAAVPLLWVVPLALYLLSFVVVFARHPLLNRRIMLALQVGLTLGLLIFLGEQPGRNLFAIAALHLTAFFVTATVCHRELADSRPRARSLTEFYLWMSLGGMLGGVFNVLVAPLLYNRVLEYPIAMIVALAVRPAWGTRTARLRDRVLDFAIPLLVFGVVSLGYELPVPSGKWADRALYAYLCAVGLLVAAWFRRPLRLALSAAALFVGIDAATRFSEDTLYQARSFFGVYRVRAWDDYVLLQHGTTTHGGQSVAPDRKREPLTYYHRDGPLGDLFRLTTDSIAPRSVALVGLGTGTTACYSRPGERWTYFEIDPLVVSIARAPRLFTYLQECQPDVQIVMGDARRSIAQSPDSSFDLIVLDAFSSDAIPVHLMTREALQLYTRKLRSGGIVAFHISNRFLDLRPVLVELARDARLAGATVDRDVTEEQKARLYYGSRWVALARHAATLSPLLRHAAWDVLAPSATVRLWTDDYSDVLAVMNP
jgi:spermidine synthase